MKKSDHKSYMYKMGDCWVVCHYDNKLGLYRETQGLTYWQARISVGTENCRNPQKCTKVSHDHRGMEDN